MGSHSVTCYRAAVTFPPVLQPKPVLDLAAPEECKAELTKIVCLLKTVTYLRNNQVVP